MAYDIGPRIKITGEKEFNDSIKKINDSLKEYGSELKAVSSKFEDNEKSQEALIEKNKVLKKQYDAQEKKLKTYQEQLKKQKSILEEQKTAIDKLTQEYGENSAEVNKAKKAYESTETNISKLKTSINETTVFTNKLSKEIDKNEQALSEMEAGTRDASTGLQKIDDSAKDVEGQLKKTEKSTDDLGDSFKTAFSVSEIADAASGLKDSVQGIVEESKEYMKIMGALDQSSKLAGYSSKQTTEIFKELYGVLGDDQTTATTTANLQALGLSQKQLKKMTDGVIGAWSKYGDSIPIDGLAESINETVKTGQVTGNFADVLNWAGTSEDGFNKKLQGTTDKSKRAKIVLDELTKQGLVESAEGFKKNNKALVDSNKAQSDFQDATRELSDTLLPIFTAISECMTAVINVFNGLPAPVKVFVIALVGLAAVISMLSPLLTAISTGMSLLGITGTTSAAGTTAAGTAASGASVGFGALSTSLLPIIAIVLGVVAAIVAVVAIIKNWDSIVKWFKKTWDNFTSALSKAWDTASTVVIDGISGLISWFGSLPGKIWTFLVNVITNIVKWSLDMQSKATQAGVKFITAVIKFISSLPGKIWTTFCNVTKSVVKWGVNMGKSAKSSMLKVVNIIAKVFIDLPKKALTWGKDMLMGFVNGIKNTIGKVVGAVKNVANKIKSFLHFSRPDEGPLRNYEEWMPDMMKGYAKGIKSNRYRIEDEISSLANSMSMALELNPDIKNSATQRSESTIIVNAPQYIDGRLVTKNTETHITKKQNAKKIMRGV